MTTPLRSLPARVVRWSRLARWLRAADAVGGVGVTWAAVQAWGPGAGPRLRALLALAAAAGAACVPFVRRRFRPVSGLVALWLSRHLEPGAAAWFIRPGGAERVLVTGRRGLRLVIFPVGTDGPAEGIEVRRTRVLLV
jgi:hypothetical protein